MNLNIIPTLLAEHQGSFWFAPPASTFAEETDSFFMVLLYISAAFFIPIVIAMVWFAIKFRQRPGYEGDPAALHNNILEITWSVIPTLLVCWIFVRGVEGYMDMVSPPPETIDINVTASKWNWAFQYPNGAESNELHVPTGKAVRLLMRSNDVLHSFFVPAFRTKQDVVPGRVVTIWFKPTLEGEYTLFCTEYCGEKHSEMLSKVVVHSPAKYEEKLVELNKRPDAIVEYGMWLFQRKGCAGCHSLEPGKVVIGPSLAGGWGTEFKIASGETVKFDEQYFEESLENPQAKVKPDFAKASLMPSFKGRLKSEEIDALRAMVKALEDGTISDEELKAMPPAEGAAEASAAQPPAAEPPVASETPATEGPTSDSAPAENTPPTESAESTADGNAEETPAAETTDGDKIE